MGAGLEGTCFVLKPDSQPQRFRRLARNDERLPAMLAGLHIVAFALLMLTRLVPVPLQVHITL